LGERYVVDVRISLTQWRMNSVSADDFVDLQRFTIPVGDLEFVALGAGPADGEPVLCLHGFPQSSWSYRHQLRGLAAAGYRVVAFDQRGYSPGARPTDTALYATPILAADVVAVADVLGFDTFHLVGHDWGAAVAWQVGGRYASRLRTLTILSVPHPYAFGKALMSGDSDQKERSSYIDVFRQVGVAEELFLADAADGNGPGAGLRDLFLKTNLPPEESAPYVHLLTQPGALTGALNWYRAASLVDVNGLGPITTPTMYVWSTEDPALGRDGAEATGEFVEGPYRFEILEGVSHWIAEEAPDRLNALLLEHLAS
jgi:pimeloyl-ACP methyl ester carboxylesterase